MSPVKTETALLHKCGVVLEHTIRLVLGRECCMPTALLNPIDAHGVRIPGLWLSDGEDGHHFFWTERSNPESVAA